MLQGDTILPVRRDWAAVQLRYLESLRDAGVVGGGCFGGREVDWALAVQVLVSGAAAQKRTILASSRAGQRGRWVQRAIGQRREVVAPVIFTRANGGNYKFGLLRFFCSIPPPPRAQARFKSTAPPVAIRGKERRVCGCQPVEGDFVIRGGTIPSESLSYPQRRPRNPATRRAPTLSSAKSEDQAESAKTLCPPYLLAYRPHP